MTHTWSSQPGPMSRGYYDKLQFDPSQQSQRVYCTEENDLIYLILQILES